MSGKKFENQKKVDEEDAKVLETKDEEKEDFFSEEETGEADASDNSSDDKASDEDSKKDDEPEKGFFDKGIFGWFKKHWKKLLAAGLITVVGGTIVFYFLGKKQIKLGKVEDVVKALDDGDDKAKILDFAEEMAKLAEKEEKKEATN